MRQRTKKLRNPDNLKISEMTLDEKFNLLISHNVTDHPDLKPWSDLRTCTISHSLMVIPAQPNAVFKKLIKTAHEKADKKHREITNIKTTSYEAIWLNESCIEVKNQDPLHPGLDPQKIHHIGQYYELNEKYIEERDKLLKFVLSTEAEKKGITARELWLNHLGLNENQYRILINNFFQPKTLFEKILHIFFSYLCNLIYLAVPLGILYFLQNNALGFENANCWDSVIHYLRNDSTPQFQLLRKADPIMARIAASERDQQARFIGNLVYESAKESYKHKLIQQLGIEGAENLELLKTDVGHYVSRSLLCNAENITNLVLKFKSECPISPNLYFSSLSLEALINTQAGFPAPTSFLGATNYFPWYPENKIFPWWYYLVISASKLLGLIFLYRPSFNFLNSKLKVFFFLCISNYTLYNVINKNFSLDLSSILTHAIIEGCKPIIGPYIRNDGSLIGNGTLPIQYNNLLNWNDTRSYPTSLYYLPEYLSFRPLIVLYLPIALCVLQDLFIRPKISKITDRLTACIYRLCTGKESFSSESINEAKNLYKTAIVENAPAPQ